MSKSKGDNRADLLGRAKQAAIAIRSYWIRQVLAFASDSQRRPEELQRPFYFRFGLEVSIAVVIAAFSLTTFGPTLIYQINRWYASEPTIPIDASRWHAAFAGTGQPCKDLLTSTCADSPETVELWSSKLSLADSEFMKRTREKRGKSFWIGLELNVTELESAQVAQASVLEIGLLNAAYRVYVNGILSEMGNGRDIYPASVQLPYSLLTQRHPIHIAVQIEHNLGSRLPIWLPSKLGGLYTFESARAQTEYWISHQSFRHLTLCAWAILIAAIFFSLWISVPIKTEYFFFALYLSIFAFLQFIEFAPIGQGAPRDLWYKGDYWLVLAQGLTGCLLGAAYARVRKTYILWIIFIESLIAGAGVLSSSDSLDRYLFKDAFMKFNTPVMMFLGASFCFSQYLFLNQGSVKLLNHREKDLRKIRLVAFGTLLSIFGTVFYMQESLLSIVSHSLDSTIQLALMVLIGVVLFLEFRDREKQFALVQRSPFHDPLGRDSDEVFGFLVSLDLVKSSILANYAAENTIETRATTVWNSMVGQLCATRGGYKVADEGDGLKIFFQASNNLANLDEVIETLSTIYSQTLILEREMQNKRIIPQAHKLVFRAGVVWGGIKPIWKEFVAVKTAEWEDARGATTFKDSTRVMDLEKQIRGNNAAACFAVIWTDQPVGSLELTGALSKRRLNVKDIGEIDLSIVDLSAVSSRLPASA